MPPKNVPYSEKIEEVSPNQHTAIPGGRHGALLSQAARALVLISVHHALAIRIAPKGISETNFMPTYISNHSIVPLADILLHSAHGTAGDVAAVAVGLDDFAGRGWRRIDAEARV